jgi:SRSO17 transposase
MAQTVAGLKPKELSQVRDRLVAFAAEMLEPVGRSERRQWGECYLRGLLLDGRRKSIQPMAERLGDGDEQCLQQFVNQSPWAWEPVRERLARRMSAELDPDAWVVDDTGFPKAGRASVGVARQYSGTLGKVGNCQIGVSLNAVSDAASCPLDWRLFLPQEWDADAERRAAAHLPAEERHRPKWQLALAMLDELAGWGLEPPPVVADCGYGEITEFRQGLEARQLDYVVELKGTTSAYAEQALREQPAYRGAGRPPKRRYCEKPSSLAALALAAGPSCLQEVAWREGSRGRKLRSRFCAFSVRPANVALRRAAGKDELAVRTVVVEWPEGAEKPVKYWLSNLPPETPLVELVRLAKLRWRVEHDYRELKDGLGLDHFEGRSFRGWHHHVTLVSVAHGFITLERLDPKADAPA